MKEQTIRELIAEYMRRFPEMVTEGTFGFSADFAKYANTEEKKAEYIASNDALIKDIQNPKKWKRDCKLGREAAYEFGLDESRTDVVWYREFYCDGYDGQIAYAVLELEGGILELGEVGFWSLGSM